MASFVQLHDNVAINHLEQLKTLPPRPKVPSVPDSRLDTDAYFRTLEQYTKDNIAAIKNATSQGVWSQGNTSPDWTKVFFSFMESCAVYLRDEYKLSAAASLYAEATPQDGQVDKAKVSKALALYAESTEKIRELAAMWGCGFVMIADLWPKSGDKDPYVSPYCGAFFTKPDAAKPFVGVAFKGTDFGSWGQDDIDWNYQAVAAAPGTLFGSSVSDGPYHSLFDTYTVSGQEESPFGQVQQTVLKLVNLLRDNGSKIVPTHVTGHSLGGSYSCFAYTQLLIDLEKVGRPDQFQLGDLYTFGCPRVGLDDWANGFHAATATPDLHAASFRVVNHDAGLGRDDYVTTVPPRPVVWGTYDGPNYVHVDAGWRVSATASPESIPTERGTTTQPPPHWPKPSDKGIHQTTSYYASLVNALKSSATAA